MSYDFVGAVLILTLASVVWLLAWMLVWKIRNRR